MLAALSIDRIHGLADQPLIIDGHPIAWDRDMSRSRKHRVTIRSHSRGFRRSAVFRQLLQTAIMPII